jgi:Bifunctional DNA primase/polymerase, N-terminal
VKPTVAELRQAALRYATAGWPVFRCQPGRKIPLDGSSGFKDGTTDLQTVSAWWRSVPYNVAIATGFPAVDVLDVDNHGEQANGFAALNLLKRAGLIQGGRALLRTRSGGLHLQFAGTDQPCGRLPGHYLDFKARGGYVLMPPSYVEADDKGPAGSYELLDHRGGDARLDWAAVCRLLDPPRAVPAPAREPGVMTARGRDGICRKVAESNETGGWASVLFWAGCRYGEKGTPLDEALADLLPAAAPWNGHEERRAVMHVTNGWHKGAGMMAVR